jgi:hypothetical protein
MNESPTRPLSQERSKSRLGRWRVGLFVQNDEAELVELLIRGGDHLHAALAVGSSDSWHTSSRPVSPVATLHLSLDLGERG